LCMKRNENRGLVLRFHLDTEVHGVLTPYSS